MRAKISDYKNWIQERAEEIAYEMQGKDFWDLPSSVQEEAYKQAEADYIKDYSDWCDHLYEQYREECSKWTK